MRPQRRLAPRSDVRHRLARRAIGLGGSSRRSAGASAVGYLTSLGARWVVHTSACTLVFSTVTSEVKDGAPRGAPALRRRETRRAFPILPMPAARPAAVAEDAADQGSPHPRG